MGHVYVSIGNWLMRLTTNLFGSLAARNPVDLKWETDGLERVDKLQL